MPDPNAQEPRPPADPAVAARLQRWSLAARLVMAVNTLIVMAILGFCLWKVGRLIGAW